MRSLEEILKPFDIELRQSGPPMEFDTKDLSASDVAVAAVAVRREIDKELKRRPRHDREACHRLGVAVYWLNRKAELLDQLDKSDQASKRGQ